MPECADTFDRRELMRAAVRLQAAERERQLAAATVERELAKWRGRVAVRDLARRAGLSGATISNLFRGRLVVSTDTLITIVRLLNPTHAELDPLAKDRRTMRRVRSASLKASAPTPEGQRDA